MLNRVAPSMIKLIIYNASDAEGVRVQGKRMVA